MKKLKNFEDGNENENCIKISQALITRGLELHSFILCQSNVTTSPLDQANPIPVMVYLF
jgi:hypothetical protein